MNIECYHNIHNDKEVKGFLDYQYCSEIEEVAKYNVYEVLEDTDIIYNNEIDYLCIYAHGSRVYRNPRKGADIDFVLFYKGSIREDDLFNIFTNESIYIEHIKCDFNPIEIEDESDIEYYIQNHDVEYHNNLLTEKRHNFKISLDDYDDEEIEVLLQSKLKDENYVLYLFRYDELIDDFQHKRLNKKKLDELIWLSKKLGKKYKEDYFFNFSDGIHYIISIDKKADLNWIDTSNVTSFLNLFNKTDFNGDISKWDTSHVKTMYACFAYSTFNGDISNWDMSSVEDTQWMFQESKFNLDISRWDMRNVTDMFGMFCKAKFNKDISNWEINPKLLTPETLPHLYTAFKSSNIKEEYRPIPILGYNGPVKINNRYKEMFESKLSKLTLDDYEDEEIVMPALTTFKDTASAFLDLMVQLFNDVIQIPITNTINIDSDTKRQIRKLYKQIFLIYDLHNVKCPVYTRENLKEFIRRIVPVFPKANLNWIDTSRITNMMYLFDEFLSKGFCGDISEWDVSHVTNMRNMFYRCEQFNCNIGNWDVSNVKVMGAMFAECYKFNLDISKWNVSNVTEMSRLFAGCHNFNLDISKWDVSNVTDMAWMFSSCKKFNLDLSKWDVSNVTRNSGFYYKAEFAKYPEKVPSFDLDKTLGNE